MARPPAPYKSDCGAQWRDRVIVRGTLPDARGFGRDYTHELLPVVPDLLSGKDKLGWDSPYEHARLAQMRERLERLVEDLRVAEATLGGKKVRSIEYLLQGADQQLKGASMLHDRWRLRSEGTYGLQYGDTLADFPAAAYWQDCANPGNILEPPGPHYGFEVPARGRAGTVTCPGRAEIQQRPRDRAAIVELYRDAARWIRCAEFSMWRNLLYARAYQDYLQTPEGQGVRTTPDPPPRRDQGVRTTPPPQRGQGGVRTTPPPDPPDMQLPEPPEIPPQPPVLPDPVGPHTVGTPPRTTHGSSGKGASGVVTAVAAVGVIYGGWWVFNKVL